MKAYWKLVLRDSALLWAITFWGGFITRRYIDYLQIFNQQPNLSPNDVSAIATFVTAPVGFCIVGCLTKTHRFRHLLIVWLTVWLTSFANFPFSNEPPARFVGMMIGGSFWLFLTMLSGWGVSGAILKFFSSKDTAVSFQTSPPPHIRSPRFADLFPDKVSKEKEAFKE